MSHCLIQVVHPCSSPQPCTLFHRPISTSPPLSPVWASPRNATVKPVKIVASAVCLHATLIPASDEKRIYALQSVRTHIREAATQHVPVFSSSTEVHQPVWLDAPPHILGPICSSTQGRKKNLWVFLPDTHTLNLMVPPFWHFRLHRSPDEQTTGGKKNDRCMFTAPFVQVGWFGDCEASDHRP